MSDPESMTRCVVEAVVRSGVYAVLSKGWSDRLHIKKASEATEPEVPLPPQIYSIASIPHDWLFQRVDAACHHGGAGTTGASLRAGIPTIIKPFFGDQFFWGDRVEALGIGSSVRKLTVENLTEALILATTDEKQIARAKLIGEQIRAVSLCICLVLYGNFLTLYPRKMVLAQLLRQYIAILNTREVSSSLCMKTNPRMRKGLPSGAFIRDESPLDLPQAATIRQRAAGILMVPLAKTGALYLTKMKEEYPVPIANIWIGMGLLNGVTLRRQCSLSYQTFLPIPRVIAGPNPSNHIYSQCILLCIFVH